MAAVVAATLSGTLGAPLRAAPPVDQYQVKAAYLYNFAKFVEWPADAFASPTAPLVLGIYGADPFGATIDTLLRDKKVGTRPFAVRRSSRMHDLRSSHIVFVGEGREPVATALAALAGSSALTVGQSDEFLAVGGMVWFQIEEGRVVFTIEAATAARARLTISSQLLRLSRPVGSGRS